MQEPLGDWLLEAVGTEGLGLSVEREAERLPGESEGVTEAGLWESVVAVADTEGKDADRDREGGDAEGECVGEKDLDAVSLGALEGESGLGLWVELTEPDPVSEAVRWKLRVGERVAVEGEAERPVGLGLPEGVSLRDPRVAVVRVTELVPDRLPVWDPTEAERVALKLGLAVGVLLGRWLDERETEGAEGDRLRVAVEREALGKETE